MKSKTPYAFWLRWLTVSILYALAFTTFWMNNGWLFVEWYAYPIFNLLTGILLSGLHYWAMSPLMRPNAKRWFSASILAYLVAISLHSWVIQNSFPNPNTTALWVTLFLPPAIAQAWALRERFKNSWIFGLLSFLPAYLLFARIPIEEIYQNYFIYEVSVQILRTLLMGASLVYLQRFQLKESSSLSTSEENVTIQEEEEIISEDEDAKVQEKSR